MVILRSIFFEKLFKIKTNDKKRRFDFFKVIFKFNMKTIEIGINDISN